MKATEPLFLWKTMGRREVEEHRKELAAKSICFKKRKEKKRKRKKNTENGESPHEKRAYMEAET